MMKTCPQHLAAALFAAVCGGATLFAQTPKLNRLLDTWPYSTLSTLTGDRAGDFAFIGEGGAIVVVDLRGVTSATDPTVYNPFYDEVKVKRVEAGKFGVRAAGLLLDRDADLLTDTASPGRPLDGLPSNDREDVLYIAGGRLGLWAMRAETSDGNAAWNTTVRLDDSPDNNPLDQTSSRFCNQLEFAVVDGTTYLLATFAEKAGGSVLRFYDIEDVRDRLDWDLASPPPALQSDGTGLELTYTWQVQLPHRAFTPSAQEHNAGYPLGIAVDEPSPSEAELTNIYVAMGPHGVLRVAQTEDPVTHITGWTTAWGPYFGDGTSYAQNGAWGHLYWNLEYFDMGRSAHFDNLDRYERPIFTDVAVQDDGAGDEGARMHYLYCTVDHLNWVRFDLGHPWTASMPIDHHEGEPIAIERRPIWHKDRAPAHLHPNGVEPLSSYGTWKQMMRAVDLPPLDGTQAGASRMDTTFARRVELVDPPPGSSFVHKLVVVTAAGLPFLGTGLPVAPRANYDYSWQKLGGIALATGGHLTGNILDSTTIVYDSADLAGNRNEIGYIRSGGFSLFVPPDQSTTGDPDTLKLLHNNQATGIVGTLQGSDHDLLNEVCLSFYDLANPPTELGVPIFLRGSDAVDARGRYNNGIGYCISDTRILTSSHNDGLPLMDGILWSRPSGNSVVIGPTDTTPIPGNDVRMETGLTCPQNNQWETPDDVPANNDYVHHYMVGQGKAPDPLVPPPLNIFAGWSIARSTVDIVTTTVGVTHDWRRVFKLPRDRWFRFPRGGYVNSATTDTVFTDWAIPRATGGEPIDYFFLATGGTSEGMIVVDRSRFLASRLDIGVPGGSPPVAGSANFAIDWPDVPTFGRQIRLNTHPEWDPIPSASSESEASCQWWLTGIEQQGTSLTWTPLLLNYPQALSQQSTPTEEWILAVPCFTLSNPHTEAPMQGLAGTVDIGGSPVSLDDTFANTWFAPTNIDAETNELLQNYSHGFVQFWRLTDLPSIQSHLDDEGDSDLPFIVLPHANTSAWRLDSVVAGEGASAQVLLFIADFGGHLYVYDVTDVPDLPRLSTGLPNAIHLIETWNAPTGPLDDLPSNVRSLAIDKVDDNHVRAYVGVPCIGIEILELTRTTSSSAWSFAATSERIETPGDPYGLTIRPADPVRGTPKSLLVSDAFGGLRIYGEELP